MTTDRRTLLLAYGIAEWASAIQHLENVEQINPDANLSDAIDDMQDELNKLQTEWYTSENDHITLDNDNLAVIRIKAIDWARHYVTTHQMQLEALLAEE